MSKVISLIRYNFMTDKLYKDVNPAIEYLNEIVEINLDEVSNYPHTNKYICNFVAQFF